MCDSSINTLHKGDGGGGGDDDDDDDDNNNNNNSVQSATFFLSTPYGRRRFPTPRMKVLPSFSG